MNRKFKLNKLLTFCLYTAAIFLSLTSCTSNIYLDARDKTNETVELTNDLLTPAHVVVTDEAFIDNKPIFAKYHPEWVNRKLNLTINEESTIDELMQMLFANSKIKVLMDDSITKNSSKLKIAPKNLRGTLVDIVDKICKELDIYYMINEYDLTLTEFETSIFQLGILPGGVDYEMGRGTDSARASDIVGGDLRSGHIKYTAPKSSEPWKNLELILEKFKSKDGQIVTHEDTATITVIDRPSIVRKVKHYIELYNKLNMQQVGIKIQVLEVELDSGFKRGIDWDLVRESLRTNLQIGGNFVNPTNILGAISGTNLGFVDWDRKVNDGDHYAGSNVLVQYLEQQGNVSIVSEPRFTVLNNQVSEIAILTDEGYAAERTLTTGTTVTPQQTRVTPGTIRTGFKLFILPTIVDGEILLQITTSISRKVSLDTFGGADTNTALIQLPTINDRRFTQRSVVPNNATLVLTGFKEQQAGTADESPFKINLAGGQTAAKKTTEIVILVTPVIIRG